MDEVLIEEKKYISSKRAAEITGYAKDYIGQLCREGRVPARLIGRGWYVLETAIQDHRFGDSEAETEKTTWEAPRYEASPIEETLPSVNRLQDEPEEIVDNQKEPNSSQNIQESWQAWFDRFDNTEKVEKEKEEEKKEIKEEAEEAEEVEKKTEEQKMEEPEEESADVNIPIHTMYKPLPADLLPRRPADQQQGREQEIYREVRIHRRNRMPMIKIAQAAAVLMATIIFVVAVIGSGYFDKYILSFNQVRAIAGVALYNR